MTVLKPYKGYTFSREIDGQVIPQSVQNLVIRSYAKKYESQTTPIGRGLKESP